MILLIAFVASFRPFLTAGASFVGPLSLRFAHAEFTLRAPPHPTVDLFVLRTPSLLVGAFDRRYSDEPNSARDSATLNEGLQVRPFVVASHHRCACCALAAVNPRPTR